MSDDKPTDDFVDLSSKASVSQFGRFGQFDDSSARVLSLQQIDDAWRFGSCLYLATVVGDDKAEAELATELLKRLDEHDQLVKAVALVPRGLEIRKHANYLIAEMLDRAAENNRPPGAALIVLIKRQLGATKPPASAENDRLRNVWDSDTAAAQLIAEGKTPSLRKIASKLNVETSTVLRWFSASQRRQFAEYWKWCAAQIKKPPRAIKRRR